MSKDTDFIVANIFIAASFLTTDPIDWLICFSFGAFYCWRFCKAERDQ